MFSRCKLWREMLSCLSRPVDFAAGYMEKFDARDGSEGTEERVLALHTEECVAFDALDAYLGEMPWMWRVFQRGPIACGNDAPPVLN